MTINSIILNGQNVEITNNKLSKLEVKTSELKNTELIVSYNIKVTNEGELEGKVKVLETIPEGYEILEMPEYWKTRTDGKLQTEFLGKLKLWNKQIVTQICVNLINMFIYYLSRAHTFSEI